MDFYNLCSAFHSGYICLKSINGSLITLIPKVDGPSRINDYRPISLLNSSIKLITKLLASRLLLLDKPCALDLAACMRTSTDLWLPCA